MQPTRGRRPGKVVWWIGSGLLLIFVGLILYQLTMRRTRFSSDAELLRRLEGQSIAPVEERPLDPKNWPQWRGQRRDGTTTAPDLLVKWPEEGPKQLWRVPGGDGYSSFSAVGETLYSMVSESGGKEAVVAWNVVNGKERWRYSYDPGKAFQYAGPRATPTIDGDRLYTVSSSGVMLCLKTEDGGEVWKRNLVSELGAQTPRWGFAFSPLIEGDLVIATPGGTNGRCLAAFDKGSGERVWATQDDPPGYSSPLAITSGGARQLVFLTGKRVLGVTVKEGKLLWEYPWHTSFEVNAATPLFFRAKDGESEDDYVFITSGYSKGCALVQIASSGGTFSAKLVYESNELCCHFSTPVLHGGHLYALDETRDLTCLEVKTGKVAWRKRGFQKGSLIRIDDRLLILGEQGHLALAECDPKAYREVARCRPFMGRCWTLPVLANGRLYLRDQSEVVCLEMRK